MKFDTVTECVRCVHFPSQHQGVYAEVNFAVCATQNQYQYLASVYLLFRSVVLWGHSLLSTVVLLLKYIDGSQFWNVKKYWKFSAVHVCENLVYGLWDMTPCIIVCEVSDFNEILISPNMTTWCFTAEDHILNSYLIVVEMKTSVHMVLLSALESGYW